MNKREFEKTARAITWRVCMLGECPSNSPELAELDAAIRAAGYHPTREHVGGFDGVTFEGNGRAVYCAAPRTRKPGKKQHCTLYELDDVRMYAEACDAVAAGDFATAQRIHDRLDSASLRNALAEGLEYLYAQYSNEEIAQFMEAPAEMSDLDAVRAIFGDRGLDIEQKRPCCCIWIAGDTKPLKDELKSFGFRWAPKKSAWYWKPQAA